MPVTAYPSRAAHREGAYEPSSIPAAAVVPPATTVRVRPKCSRSVVPVSRPTVMASAKQE